MRSVVDERIARKAVARGKPTVASGRKAAVLKAQGRAVRPPPGAKSGACIQRGSAGTWESHLSSCPTPGLGDRVTQGPGVVWGFRPDHEPQREATNAPKPARYWGASDKRSVLRRARGSLSGASYLRRWGTQAPRTHWREGHAGHPVELDRPTGETVRSPTVTPKLQRLAAQAAHDPDRVCTPLASLIDTDLLREAYRPTSKSSAAGSEGGTAQQ